MQIIFLMTLFLLGACIGSFLCCQARRLHLSTTKKKVRNKHSICLHCGKKLKWYDNIPIFSWIMLRGKCRECGKKIGLAELFSEVGLAIALLALGTTINVTSATALDYSIFVITALLIFSLFFLAIYDGIYGQLPVPCLIFSIIFAIILLGFKEWSLISTFGFDITRNIINPIAAVLILGGLYLFLYQISKGKWVGDGDWILGVAIGLGLGRPWLALITLFISNLLAYTFMAPVIKKKKDHKIHFGPFMVTAFIIVVIFSNFFLSILP